MSAARYPGGVATITLHADELDALLRLAAVTVEHAERNAAPRLPRMRLVRFLLAFPHVRSRADLERPLTLADARGHVERWAARAGLVLDGPELVARARAVKQHRERVRSLGVRLVAKIGSTEDVDRIFATAAWREGKKRGRPRKGSHPDFADLRARALVHRWHTEGSAAGWLADDE